MCIYLSAQQHYHLGRNHYELFVVRRFGGKVCFDHRSGQIFRYGKDIFLLRKTPLLINVNNLFQKGVYCLVRAKTSLFWGA